VDHFQSCSTSGWDEGQTRGQWSLAFDGYGNVGVGRAGDNKLLYQEPTTATAPEKTHASMVLSTKAFQGVDMTLRQKTARQLRVGSKPKLWEVAWVVWNYRDDSHFYYFILKTNGIELGKANPDYPRGQRFLYTATEPRFTIGDWDTIRVRQVGSRIDVWVDGKRVVRRLVDSSGVADDQPYTSRRIGMYAEDARVFFDDVRAGSTQAR
jgi:hypothetical protein